MPSVQIMLKPVSAACNLHCSYCFYADEAQHRAAPVRGVMTRETAEAVIRAAFRYAASDTDTVTFAFQGGEPTLAGAAFFRSWRRRKTAGGSPCITRCRPTASAWTHPLRNFLRRTAFWSGCRWTAHAHSMTAIGVRPREREPMHRYCCVLIFCADRERRTISSAS